MASKASYYLTAVIGIAAASGAAWWYQTKPIAPTEMVSAAVGTRASGPNSAASAPAGAASAAMARPAGVEVAKVEKMPLQDDAQAVGSLRSRQSVMLRPEVAGRVKHLGFTDGQPVRRGQMLVQLDDVLQRAEIKQAQAQVSIAQANLKRNQELVAQNFVAQRVLEESAANLQVVEAQLALSCARLSRMAILAPFDATVGIRVVNVGDYVKDGADLINLEDTSSMFVDFRLPERFQGKVRLQQPVELTLDAFPGRAFKARIEAIDPLLDVNGRSVGLRAILPNSMGEPARESGRGGPGGPGGAGGPGGRPGSPGGAGVGAGAASPSGLAGAPRPGNPSITQAGRPNASLQAGVGPGNSSGAGGQGAREGARAGGAGPAGVAAGARVGTPAGAPGSGGAQGNANPVDANGCPVDVASTALTETSASAVPGGALASRSGGPGTGAGAGSRGAGAPGRMPPGASQGNRSNIPGQAGAGGNPMPLRPGMFARVNTVFSINEAALVIPEEAVVPQGGRQFVIKAVLPEEVTGLDKSKLPDGVKFVSLRQEVRLGVRRAGRVEVVSGLDEGQSIVVAGHQRLQRDGTPLRIVELGSARGAQAGASAAGAAPAALAPITSAMSAAPGAPMPAIAASR